MITGGFGATLDLKTGAMRQWFMGRDGVKRWADNSAPCEPNGNRTPATHPAAIEQPGYAPFLLAAERWSLFRDAGSRFHKTTVSNWFWAAAQVCNDPAVKDELQFISEFFEEYRH